MSETLREVDQQNPKVAALIGNLEEIPATRKMVNGQIFNYYHSTD